MSKRKSKKNDKQIVTIISFLIVLATAILGGELFLKTDKNSQAVQTSGTVLSDKLEVDFIDVGQADSILIINKDETMLIDAGNNENGNDVVKHIKEKGITKINYLVGTHPHADHIGGLDDVINSDLEIENVYMPKIQTNTKTFEDVLDALKNKNLKVTAPVKGDTFKIGEANCKVMTDSILDTENLNLSSIVVRLEFGENSFLFMGDAETENEKTINWPKTNVLKVGHHGSNTSTSDEIVKVTSPKEAIISCGEKNRYKFPHAEVLNVLNNYKVKIRRTDLEGTIVYKF